jgi:hypothetical protein
MQRECLHVLAALRRVLDRRLRPPVERVPVRALPLRFRDVGLERVELVHERRAVRVQNLHQRPEHRSAAVGPGHAGDLLGEIEPKLVLPVCAHGCPPRFGCAAATGRRIVDPAALGQT